MEINNVHLGDYVTYKTEFSVCSKGKVVGLDLRTKSATVELLSGAHENIKIEILEPYNDNTYDVVVESTENEVIGFYDVGMLKQLLNLLSQDMTIYGGHPALGEIKIKMNPQKNRISVFPLSTNSNKFPEDEIFGHMLNDVWNWHIIKQHEEI